MSDDRYEIEIVAKLQDLLNQLKSAEASGESLTSVMVRLKKEIAEIGGLGKFMNIVKGGFGDAGKASSLFITNVQKIKKELQDLQKTSGNSLKDVVEGFRNANSVTKEFSSREINRAVKDLEQLAKNLANLKKTAKSGKVNVLFSREDIDRAKVQMMELRQVSGESLSFVGNKFRDLNKITKEFNPRSITQALKELGAEERALASGGKKFFSSENDNTKIFLANVQTVKTRLRELQNETGKPLKDVVEGLRETNKLTGQFSTKEINRAVKDLEQLAKNLANFKKALSQKDAKTVLTETRENIDKIKLKLLELQKSGGQNLKTVTLAFRELNKTTKEFSSGQITQAFNELNTKAKVTTFSIRGFFEGVARAKAEILRLRNETGRPLNEVVASFRELNKVTKEFSARQITVAGNQIKGLSGSIGGLGKISQYVFGTILGVSAISVLRDIINFVGEATKAFNDFSISVFGLELAVRALRRAGVDVTLDDFQILIEEIKSQFPILSEAEITQAVAGAARLTRTYGFTFEDIAKVIRSAAIIAVGEGRSIADIFSVIETAMSTGKMVGLNKTQIALTKLNITAKALELGFEETWQALDGNAQAKTYLEVMVDQLEGQLEDVGKITETTGGQFLEMTANWADFKKNFGGVSAAVFAPLIELLNNLFVSFDKNKDAILDGLIIIMSTWNAMLGTLGVSLVLMGDIIKDIFDDGILSDESKELLKTDMGEVFSDLERQYEEHYRKLIEMGDIFEDEIPLGTPELEIGLDDDLVEATDDLLHRIQKILMDFEQGVRDAGIELGRKLEDLDIEYNRKQFDENVDYQNDIAKINRETQDKIKEAQQKYREEEIKAERDFQNKLQDLREKFLFDLEDALHERDARQVLRLIRQYNMDKNQIVRNYEDEKLARAMAFANELKDIEEQRQIKLRELKIEHEERMKELALQKEREREDLLRNYAQELEDLVRHRDDMLTELRAGLDAENLVIFDALMARIGIIANAMAVIRALLAWGGGLNYGSYGYAGGGYSGSGGAGGGGTKPVTFAEGGTLIANKPTLAMFGEAGAEMATFTPMNRVGKNQDKIFSNGNISSSNGSGKIRLEVGLRDGLIAEIIDASVGEVADIVIREIS